MNIPVQNDVDSENEGAEGEIGRFTKLLIAGDKKAIQAAVQAIVSNFRAEKSLHPGDKGAEAVESPHGPSEAAKAPRPVRAKRRRKPADGSITNEAHTPKLDPHGTAED